MSPAMLVALIALFVAIGGISWAAAKITTSDIKNGAVTTKKLHNNAVSTKKIKNNAVTGAKAKESSFGQVPEAAHATNANHATSAGSADNLLTALVNSNGTLIHSKPAGTTSSRLSNGLYEVNFGRDVTNCTFFTALGGDDFVVPPGETGAVPRAGTPNAIFVGTFNSSGTLTDRDFYAQVVC